MLTSNKVLAHESIDDEFPHFNDHHMMLKNGHKKSYSTELMNVISTERNQINIQPLLLFLILH